MKRDDGMTIIELMISILLLTIIMGALVTAMAIAFRTMDATRQKVTDTSGAQLLTSWLVTDAQNADKVNPAATCESGSLLELRWTDSADNTTVTSVVYKVEGMSGSSDSQLIRAVYNGACTQQSRQILVKDVSPTATDTFASCTPSPCNDNSVRVGLTVKAFSQDLHTNAYVPYTFQVFGTRRTQ